MLSLRCRQCTMMYSSGYASKMPGRNKANRAHLPCHDRKYFKFPQLNGSFLSLMLHLRFQKAAGAAWHKFPCIGKVDIHTQSRAQPKMDPINDENQQGLQPVLCCLRNSNLGCSRVIKCHRFPTKLNLSLFPNIYLKCATSWQLNLECIRCSSLWRKHEETVKNSIGRQDSKTIEDP